SKGLYHVSGQHDLIQYPVHNGRRIMANNRVYLKCQCGSERFIAKRFGEGYYTVGTAEEYVGKLEQWFDDHAFCGNMDHFSVQYEHDAGWDTAHVMSAQKT